MDKKTNGIIYANIAEIASKINHHGKAISLLNKAIEFDSSHKDEYEKKLYEAYVANKEYENAIQLKLQQEDCPQKYIDLIHCYDGLNDVDGKLQCADKLIQMGHYFGYLVYCFECEEEDNKGLTKKINKDEYYQEVLNRKEDNEDYNILVAEYLFDCRKDYRKAIELYEEVYAPALADHLAQCYIEVGDDKNALETLLDAKQNLYNLTLIGRLIEDIYGVKEAETAKYYYKKALDKAPFPMAALKMARLLLLVNKKYEEALVNLFIYYKYATSDVEHDYYKQIQKEVDEPGYFNYAKEKYEFYISNQNKC